jgi:hypothetical protein
MIHKIFNLKRARTQKIYLNPFAYLLRKIGRKLEPVILSGDVKIAKALIKNSRFNQRYTSLVLTFNKFINEDKAFKIIESYERCAYVGIDDSKIARVWVLHQEHDRTELHCIVVNSYLRDREPDLRWQHAYVNVDRMLFKSWQELINIEYDLLSPDDPSAKRFRSHPYSPLNEHDHQIFEEVDIAICREIKSGKIASRKDILEFLKEKGYQTNPKQSKIGIRSPETGRYYLHLEGQKYEESFDLNAKPEFDFADTEARKTHYQKVFEVELRKRQIRMALKFGDEQPLPPIEKISRTDLRHLIDRDLDELIYSGEVSSREELTVHLKAQGFTISRESKSSVSIWSPLLGKQALRLTGPKYRRDYDFKAGVRSNSPENSPQECTTTKEGKTHERIDKGIGKSAKKIVREIERASTQEDQRTGTANRADGTPKRAHRGRTIQDSLAGLRWAAIRRKIKTTKSDGHSQRSEGALLAISDFLAEPFRVAGRHIRSLLSDIQRRKDRENQIRQQRENLQRAIGEINRKDPER